MKMEHLVSAGYRKVLQSTHAGQKGWGGGGKYWVQDVLAFATELGGVQTVLDYGCGQGVLKQKLEGELLEVHEYDPGIVGKDDMPAPADIVVCTDVLEHIEPDRVDITLQHLRMLTLKGAFLVIATGPANLILTDGRNAHLTQRPLEWWVAHLQQHWFHVHRHDAKHTKAIKLWCTPAMAKPSEGVVA